ncbi:MAG: aminotransferase class I/II-fold pyridoxal phosphate-dependent enzyme [Thermomicrobiales bacterium]
MNRPEPGTDQPGFGTRCIHAGEAPDPTTGAHGVPLYQNVTYAFQTLDQIEGMRSGNRPHFSYSPRGNPTVRCLELKLASLEGTQNAVAFNSGMAAISTTLLTLLAGGGHLVAANNIYDLTRMLISSELASLGCSVTYVDQNDPDVVTAAMAPETRAIYAEPFSNPQLQVSDVRQLAHIASEHNVPLIIDNTFLSPALLRPAELGADIVIHSATKYLSGNGQIQAGVVAGRSSLLGPIREQMMRLGTVMPPFAAWILLAGVHTLSLRMSRHSSNALHLARVLEAHPAVEYVAYPGLYSHPRHQLAASLVGNGDDRFGGMLSFMLRGDRPALAAFIDSLELCTVAVSLGDCSTLVWPWTEGNLVRVSVGIEDVVDLESDISRALEAALQAV